MQLLLRKIAESLLLISYESKIIHNYNGKAKLTDDRRTKQIQAQLK